MTRSIDSRALAGFALCFVSIAPLQAQHAVALTEQAPRSVTGIRFRYVADGAVRGGFALIGGRLLFGTESGSAYAIDSRTGQLSWRRSLGSPVLSTPAILGARAYVTTWDNVLHALDVGSGRELWRRDLGRTLGPNDYWEYYVSSPVISGGRLYVGGGSGRVFAVEAASGKFLWSSNAGSRVRTTPLIAGDKVIVGTMSGHVIALDRRDGRPMWKFATIGAAHDYRFKHNDTTSVVTQPIVTGQTVIAGGRDGNIYGVDLNSGGERWHETHDGGSWILGLAADRAVFYSGSGSALIMQAADAATGKEIWRVPTGNAMFGGVAKAGDVLVSNGAQGSLFGFDSRSGEQLWRLRLPDMSFASPLVAPGVVFTGADDGSVIGIDTGTATAPAFDRYVYSYTNEPDASFFWFKPEVVASIRGAFASSGYTAIGSDALADALTKPIGDHGRKIIVLGDTRVPARVDGTLLRKFVDSGGILVLLGPNPLAFSFGSNGAPAGQDEAKAAAAFGMDAADTERDNGYNVSTFTPRARALGLIDSFVGYRWARPEQVIPLALDRSGMASAWAKRFPNGGLVISLPVPRYRPKDLTQMINAIDLLARREQWGPADESGSGATWHRAWRHCPRAA